MLEHSQAIGLPVEPNVDDQEDGMTNQDDSDEDETEREEEKIEITKKETRAVWC